MSVGPDPEKRLHANRPYAVTWNSANPRTVLSRSDILAGRTPAAWGSNQSPQVASTGENRLNLGTLPADWPRQGYPITVPKCVILSSLPYWTAYWKSCYFYGPSDVIGQMFTDPFLFGNYYYFDQWNDVNPDEMILDPGFYCDGATCTGDFPDSDQMNNSAFFGPENFNPPVPEDQKFTWRKSYDRFLGDAPHQDLDQINETTNPPSPRFSQIIGHIRSNPYYMLHRQIMAAFVRAKEILEADPVDPIYVTIPEWLPLDIKQIRNGYLNKVTQKLNAGHGTGCEIVDVVPCYTNYNIPWAPPYPNPDDDRNKLSFDACQVPWLATCDPGFGTNVLHLYVGHPCMRYSAGNTIFDYQAWPLSPEGVWIGPIFQGSYTGAGLPFFKGRRNVWRDFGFNYGYTAGAAGVYANYTGLIEAAANKYKEEFFKFRGYATRLFTYPATWNIEWDTFQLWNDQKHDCHSTQFYFGFDFDDFQASHSNVDNWYNDCSGSPGAGPTHIKFAEHIGNEPSTASIQEAIDTFYPPIKERVENYYFGIEPGAAEFYELAIAGQGLADYNVQYGGSFGALLDPDAIVAYVRNYFKENP